ncbi:hypothetical protein TWF694_001999 [Orbilia ellipsospora]|uniref:EKC/KEOPS complex subunit GON7 n=1 Tax=Orbilia ellipsospora TaxID=2528407 RepID=A0AAV9X4A4_9PEZI
MAESIHPPKLIATYTHPTSHPPTAPQTFNKPLPPPPTPEISTSHSAHTHNDPTGASKPEGLHTAPSTTATRAHLKALRDAVRDVQADINVFLTARMEEEKNTFGADKSVEKSAEDMERDGEVEEELDDETKKLEEEVARLKREEEAEGGAKGKGKKRKKGKD